MRLERRAVFATIAINGFLLLALALVSVGCGRDRADQATLRLLAAQTPEALDTRFTTSAIAQRLGFLVHAPLLYIADDLTTQPFLAASFQRVDDVTWEVILRDDALFSNGERVTSADVAFTFLTLGSADVRSPHAAKFKRVLRVETPNPKTARFVLDKPFAAFPLELCSLGILSEKDCRGDTLGCRARQVASGPFVVAAFDPANDVVKLARNEKWRGGATKLQGLEIRVVKDGTTRLLELMDGKADLLVGDVEPVQLDVIARHTDLTVLRQRGLGYSYLAMNLRGPRPGQDEEGALAARALADAKVRRAIAHALDTERVIAAKLRGAAVRADGMLPPGHWAKDASLIAPTFDPALSKRLLDEAGFPMRDGNGRFSITMSTTTNRLRRSIALIFAHQLRSVGINVDVRVGEWGTLYADIKRGNFEMFSAKWTPVVEPDLFHWVFHSSSIPGEKAAGGNRGGYRSKKVDAWIEEGRTLQDPEARRTPYQAVERRLLEDLPYVPLWFEDEIAVAGARVQGFQQFRSGALFGLATTSLRPATSKKQRGQK